VISSSLNVKHEAAVARFCKEKRRFIVLRLLRRKAAKVVKEERMAMSIWRSSLAKHSMKQRVMLLRQSRQIEGEKQSLLGRFEQLQVENQELASVYQQQQ
jgi:hypothetical protein